jgi:hypothetical protein
LAEAAEETRVAMTRLVGLLNPLDDNSWEILESIISTQIAEPLTWVSPPNWTRHISAGMAWERSDAMAFLIYVDQSLDLWRELGANERTVHGISRVVAMYALRINDGFDFQRRGGLDWDVATVGRIHWKAAGLGLDGFRLQVLNLDGQLFTIEGPSYSLLRLAENIVKGMVREDNLDPVAWTDSDALDLDELTRAIEELRRKMPAQIQESLDVQQQARSPT